MTEFLQLHLLTSYPPANLNRDDLGRPKTAVFGGKTRLRISSQSLKRAWRQSSVFEGAVGASKGWRTREVGKRWVYVPLINAGVAEDLAQKSAELVAAKFGKQDDDAKLTKQLVHVSPEEKAAIDALVQVVIAGRRPPAEAELELLRREIRAADIALFGRMLADEPGFNMEAAAQVAHAITVHPVTIEDDYFTAVDDLNDRQDNVGAGHVGETEFAAGVFYLYVCIDCDRLVANLQGDNELARQTLRALTEAACTVAPSGKQNSFASRACASYALAERGERQPRALSVAFLDGVNTGDFVREASKALAGQMEAFDSVYGPLARERYYFDVAARQGTLAGLLDFVAAPKSMEAMA